MISRRFRISPHAYRRYYYNTWGEDILNTPLLSKCSYHAWNGHICFSGQMPRGVLYLILGHYTMAAFLNIFIAEFFTWYYIVSSQPNRLHYSMLFTAYAIAFLSATAYFWLPHTWLPTFILIFDYYCWVMTFCIFTSQEIWAYWLIL